MIKKKYIKYAIITILFLLAIFIPAAKVGSEQPHGNEPVVVEESEDALHTPLVTDKLALAITKTIEFQETGGTLDCSKKGLSGEIGCHQFLPSTWAGYSKDVFGSVVEQTLENAEYVTLVKVKGWLDAGYTPRQIFLIWNQGNTGQCKSGVNRHGVAYDSCAYAEEALSKLSEFINTI